MEKIRAATGKNELIVANGKTVDIQNVIIAVSKDGIWKDTKEFSKDFKATYNGLWALWRWVKNNIQYIEDPDGVQWVKDPARLYSDGSGDCKSFTLFIISVLQNLGIPYIIRFTSYIKGSKRVTHVYPVAILNGKEVILDAVWYAFDSQKSYTYKQDFNFKIGSNKIGDMTKVYRLGAVGTAPIVHTTNVMVTAQEIERAASNIPDSYLQNDITEMTKEQFAHYMGFKPSVSGIGSAQSMAFQMPVLANSGAQISGVLQKVADAIKNAWKKVVNWVFKTGLKLCAPYFLYTFIKKKVGKKTDAKKAHQDKILNWMSSVTGTPIDQFQMAISASIKEKTGKTPETLLNELSGSKVSSPVAIAMAILPIFKDKKIMDAIKTVITKIIGIFKKAAPAIDSNAASDPSELAAEAASIQTEDITKADTTNPAQNAPVQPTPKADMIPNLPTGSSPNSQPLPADMTAPQTDNTPKAQESGGGMLVPIAIVLGVFALSQQ